MDEILATLQFGFPREPETDKLTQGMMTNESALTGFTLWPKEEVLRIEALSNQEVLSELERIMDGRNYSWHKINELMTT